MSRKLYGSLHLLHKSLMLVMFHWPIDELTIYMQLTLFVLKNRSAV